MNKLALQLIFNKKKSSLFFICIIALSIALMLSAIPVFGAVIDASNEILGNRYGTHNVILFNISSVQYSKIIEEEIVKAHGIIYNFGSWEIDGTDNFLTVGHLDYDALSIGKQKLLQGRMPQAANEIVLEQNAMYRFSEEVNLKDSIHFTYNGKEYTFQVVGILSGYTNNWYTGENQLKRGYNDLPNALVDYEIYSDLAFETHALVEYIERNAYYDYQKNPEIRWAENYLYTMNGYEEQIRPLEMFRTVFFLIILVAVFLVFCVMIPLY
ncbi:MAG: hypothetical protein ACOX3W_09485 [Christensenellaceae bacterium]|jgi:hypothetical protein